MEGKENYPRLAKKTRFGKFLEIFLGRGTIITLLFVLQVIALVFLFADTVKHFTWIYEFITTGCKVIMAIYLINKDMDTNTKCSWLVVILLFPIVGIPLYFFIMFDFGHRASKVILGEEEKRGEAFVPYNRELLDSIPDTETHQIASYLSRNASAPVYADTKCHYYPFGANAFPEMLDALESAKEFIFLEYFIIDEGFMWGNVLDVLQRKVREGVEVRVLYDGLNAFVRLPYTYPKRLEELGIKARMVSPIRPFVSTHYNNRDHRKILVVDNRVAFTGGINLADEYIGRRTIYGVWKDNAIRVEGEAVTSMTITFLKTWNAVYHDSDYRSFLKPHPVEGEGLTIPYADSPLDGERVGETVYQTIIGNSRRYCWIMTPYLILDSELEDSLKRSAKRGVDVRILLPHIPDKKYAFCLARSHYRSLLDAGVRIYEYTPGFVHSKVFLSDDREGVVGTINLDYRSLYLHFENAVYFTGRNTLAELKDDFEESFGISEEIDPDTWRNRGMYNIMGKVLKIMAPLM